MFVAERPVWGATHTSSAGRPAGRATEATGPSGASEPRLWPHQEAKGSTRHLSTRRGSEIIP